MAPSTRRTLARAAHRGDPRDGPPLEPLAVSAKARGDDYINKPFDNDELFFTGDRAAETGRLRQAERERALEQASGVRIIGQSPALIRVLDTATRIAATDVTALVRRRMVPALVLRSGN